MKNTIIVLLSFLVISCAPRVNYLGDEYAPTSHVDIFFDEVDIERNFKVMGLISANNSNNTFNSLDKIKEKMVEEARMKGADAILFITLLSDSVEANDRHLVEAKLLKYK